MPEKNIIIKRNGFVIVGMTIMEDTRVDKCELLAYLALASFADSDREAYPSYASIARRARVSRRKVIDSINKLCELGYIEKQVVTKNPNDNETNIYTLKEFPNDEQNSKASEVVNSNHQGSELNSPSVVNSVHQGSELSSPKQYPINNNQLNNNSYVELDKPTQPTAPTIPYAEIVDYLNKRTNAKWKPTTAKTKELIKARFNEGFTVDDFKKVIDIKVAEWGDSEKMRGYLRPVTLFSNKFESYLQQANMPSGNFANAKKRHVVPEWEEENFMQTQERLSDKELRELKKRLRGDKE